MRVEFTPEELLDLMGGLLARLEERPFKTAGTAASAVRTEAVPDAMDVRRDCAAASEPERASDGDLPVCNKLVHAVTVWLSLLEKWAATCRGDTGWLDVFSFARVEFGSLHVHVSMPTLQPDGLTLYDNMLDFPDEAGWKDTFNLIVDGIADGIGMTLGEDMRGSLSDYMNAHLPDGQA